MDILASLIAGKIVTNNTQPVVDIVETLKQAIEKREPPPPPPRAKKAPAPKISSKFLPEVPIPRRNSIVKSERSNTPPPKLSSKFLPEVPIPRRNSIVKSERSNTPPPKLSSKFLPEALIPRRNSKVGDDKPVPLPKLSSKFLPEALIPRRNSIIESERLNTLPPAPKLSSKFLQVLIPREKREEERSKTPPPVPKLSSNFLSQVLIPREKHEEEAIPRVPPPKINIKFLPDGILDNEISEPPPPPKAIVHTLSSKFLPEIRIPRQTPTEIKPRLISFGNEVLPEIKKITPNLIHALHYEIPKTTDMAVLFVFFDYVGSTRILMNYLYTIEKMKLAKIPYFTIELVLSGKNPRIKDAFHVSSSSYLFQKEHLVRLLETKVPKKYTKLLSLDLDIIFDDETWYTQLSRILETKDIVQCFKTAKWLDLTYQILEKEAETCVLHVRGDSFWTPKNGKAYHPGFGWAFTRQWYNKVGFYDLAIIGSGDTIFSYALFGLPYGKSNEGTDIYTNSSMEWAKKIRGVKLGYLPVDIYHLYHGSMKKRQYVSRYEYFKNVKNIEDVSSINNTGAYELTDQVLNNKMRMFFRERDDDGTD